MTDTPSQTEAMPERDAETLVDGKTARQRADEAHAQRLADEEAAATQEASRRKAAAAFAEGDSKFITNANALRSVWTSVDPNTEEFVDGVKLISNAKMKNGVFLLETVNSNAISWMQIPAGKDSTQEFIGLTASQAKKTPLNAAIADDIMAMQKARHGNQPVELIASSPQNMDILWLAAKRAGLEVKNAFPSPEALAAWDEYQKAAATAQEGVTLAEGETAAPEAEADATPAPKSAFAGDLGKPRAASSRFGAIEAELTEERLRSFDEEGLKALGKTIDEECKKGVPAQGTPEFQSLSRIVSSIDARQKEIDDLKIPGFDSTFMREAPAAQAAVTPQAKPAQREP